MEVIEKKFPIQKTGSQALGSGAMSVETSFSRRWALRGVYIHFSGSCSQTVTVTRTSQNGSNYDTVLKTEALSSATDFVFRPTGLELLDVDDEIKVEVTTGGSTTAYLTINGEEY